MYREESDSFGPPPVGRSFPQLCTDACDLRHAIQRLESDKLSAKSYLKAALLAAAITPKEMLDLMDKVLACPNRSVYRLVRSLSALIISGRVGEVPSAGKLEKLCRAYAAGEPGETALQLVALQLTPAQLFCLAVHLTALNEPSAFGTLEDGDDRGSKLREYRQLLDLHFAAMRETYGASDLNIGGERVAGDVVVPRGFVRVTFRQCPGLTPDDVNWPQQLVEHLLATSGVSTEREPIKRKSVLPIKEISRRKVRSDELQPAKEAT